MDAFLSELFDVSGVDFVKFIDPTSGGLSHSALMRDERLIFNAEFRFIWKILSGGALPSARCFAEFLSVTPSNQTGLGIAHWILNHFDGPFHILKATVLMTNRLVTLQDGRLERFMLALRDPSSGALHTSLVEKIVDRHSCPANDLISKYIKKPLFVTYRDLTWKSPIADTTDQLTNFASGMIASLEEEAQMVSGRMAADCPSLLRIGPGDAMKRRFARDLHFLRRQFERPYLTAPPELMQFAEVVRLAIDAPWVVDERHAMDVEQHSPVIACSCVRLHMYQVGKEETLPPARVTRNTQGKLPCSAIVIFGADTLVLDSELGAFGVRKGYDRIFRAYTHTDIIVNRPFDQGAGPMVYPLFFGQNGSDHWSYGLIAASLKKHMCSPCPLVSMDPADAHLLVDRCVLRAALSRRILGHTPVTFRLAGSTARQIILAIDTRHDPSPTVMSVAMALSSLAKTTDWGVRIMCSRRNKAEFRRMLLPICPSATFDDTAPELNVPEGAFVVESCYNSLMKNPRTWRDLLPAEVVLTVQDDGILMRPGIESLVSQHSLYLGAPWADHPANTPLKSMVPSLMGNGGLSLRDVRAMIMMSEGLSDRERRRLFHTRLEPIPEDVTFSRLVSATGTQVTQDPALSCEQVPCGAALGFHKPWPYWSVQQTHEHMELLIRESAVAIVS